MICVAISSIKCIKIVSECPVVNRYGFKEKCAQAATTGLSSQLEHEEVSPTNAQSSCSSRPMHRSSSNLEENLEVVRRGAVPELDVVAGCADELNAVDTAGLVEPIEPVDIVSNVRHDIRIASSDHRAVERALDCVLPATAPEVGTGDCHLVVAVPDGRRGVAAA